MTKYFLFFGIIYSIFLFLPSLSRPPYVISFYYIIDCEKIVHKILWINRGIDAPELKMEYGKESRNGLVNLIKGKCVVIYVYDKDQFERYVGDIYCDGVFIQVKQKILTRRFFWLYFAWLW